MPPIKGTAAEYSFEFKYLHVTLYFLSQGGRTRRSLKGSPLSLFQFYISAMETFFDFQKQPLGSNFLHSRKVYCDGLVMGDG